MTAQQCKKGGKNKKVKVELWDAGRKSSTRPTRWQSPDNNLYSRGLGFIFFPQVAQCFAGGLAMIYSPGIYEAHDSASEEKTP